MEICNRIVFIVTVILLELSWTSRGQRLFSIFTQVLPTLNADEVNFYSHLSWEQQSVTTCFTPACLRVYKLTNKTAQFFGRMTNYQWSCTQGCVTNDVISDLSKLMFTDVSDYHGNKWESGEELVTYKFKSGTSDNVYLSLQQRNGSVPQTIETVHLNIGIRNDTNRSNVSPSVAVLPIYQIPLGCTLEIELSPYDGDGDYTQCTWTQKLQTAALDQKSCTIKIQTSTSGGYVAGQYYDGTVSIEDYSNTAVSIYRRGRTSVTHGPFSHLPVMFTVYISPALPDQKDCQQAPVFESHSQDNVGSYLYPVTYTSTFTAIEHNATMLTVGHLSTVFKRTTNITATTESAEWVLGVNETGIYRTCVMLYNNKGVPGETRCDTLLIADADECAGNNTCIDQSGGHCEDHWHYHTCSYDKQETKSELNIGLIAGAAGGGAFLLVAMATGIILYLRYISKKKQKVEDETEKNINQEDVYNKHYSQRQ